MITFEKQENGVLFTFTNSDKYLYGSGTIEVPFNSLSIIQDESDMITLRKSASWDIFLSGRFDTDFGYASKEEAVNALKEILYDEAGISEEEVQEMIDAATSGIPSSQVIEQLQNDLNAVSGTVSSHTANTEVHVTQAEKNTWNGKVDEGYVTDYAYSKNQIDGFLENATTLLQTISGEVDTKQDILTAGANITISGNVISAEAGNNIIELTQEEYDALTEKDPDALYIITDAQEINMNDYYTKSEVTTALAGKLDASAYTPTDLSEYWTSGQTQEAINAATSGIPSSQVIEALRNDLNTVSGDVENKQDVLSAGSGISIDGNVISVTGASITVDSELDETSNNPVANSAITNAFINNEYTVSQAINSLNNRVAAVESGGTGGGITSGEVQTMIDDSLDIYWTSVQTQSAIDDAKAYYVDFAAMSVQGITDADWDGLVAAINAHRPILVKVNTANGYVNAITAGIFDNTIIVAGADEGNASKYTFTKNGSNDYSVSISTKQFVTQAEKDAWNAKVDASAIATAITSGSTDSEIPTAKATYDAIQAGGGGGVTVDPTLDTGSTNPVANSAITTAMNGKVTNISGERDSYAGRYYGRIKMEKQGSINTPVVFPLINGKCIVAPDISTLIYNSGYANTLDISLVETSAITSAMTSSSTDAQVPSAKAVYDQLGGLKFVKLTQNEYDNLATKDSSTLYIISD